MLPAPRTAAASPAVTPERRGYPFLLSAVASWFLAWGIQMVIFQWLVVEVLRETASRAVARAVARKVVARIVPESLFIEFSIERRIDIGKVDGPEGPNYVTGL